MIEATHLTRRYGPLMAVDNVSFQIGRGEIVDLLAGNLWLHHIGRARLDLTEGKIYSLSKTSHRYLQQLRDRC
ncbi:MAG: hypothetical protein P8X63_06960 [Desulfuromonadaceae bacterium]